ncbi:MAG: DUF4124 domain-containing protein [Methylococcus sp.]
MSKLMMTSLLILAGYAHAESVYKCHGPTGSVTYSSTPCYDGSTGGAIEITDNSLDYSESRRQNAIKAEEREAARQEARRQSEQAAARGAVMDNSEVKERLLKELDNVKRSNPRELGDNQRKHKKEIEIMRMLTDLEIAERGGTPEQLDDMQQERRIDELERKLRQQKTATNRLRVEQQTQQTLLEGKIQSQRAATDRLKQKLNDPW